MQVKKGVIKSFDSGTYRATVGVRGSLAVWLEQVAVARNIPAGEMVAGRDCVLILFDDANPADGVVVSVYD